MSRSETPLQQRFPAIRSLEVLGWRRIPFVHQLQTHDCGAACLTMVLRHLGRWVTLDEIVRDTQTSSTGTSGGMLLRAARLHGLQGRGVSVDARGVRHLPRGSILHWDFVHFVVLESLSRRGVVVVDPALGRRRLSWDEFGQHFTGVALELRPGLDFERRRRDVNPMAAYLQAVLSQRSGLRRALVSSTCLRVVALAVPLVTATIIDTVIPRGDVDLLLAVVVGLVALFGFQALLGIVRAHVLMQLQANLDLRMTLGFVEHLVSLPQAFFQRRTAGDLLTRVHSNAIVRDALTHTTLSTLLDGVMVLLYLGVIAIIDAGMAAIVLGLAGVYSVVFALTRRKIRDLTTERLQAQALTEGALLELIHGIETLKACGAEHRVVQRWAGFYVGEFNVQLRLGRYDAVAGSITGVVGALGYVATLAYGAAAVLDDSITLGTMLALTALAGLVLGPVGGLFHVATTLQRITPHLDRIQDVRDKPPEQTEAMAVVDRLQGGIEVEQVSFTYEGARTPAVRDVSLSVPAGASVAIVGASGSGKSTLAHLLIGMHTPHEGSIRFDGRDLRDIDLESLRGQLGVVPQDTRLFLGTFRDNISLFDPAISIERITAAARAAEIHDEIIRLPMGYDCPIAEGGSSLSGGQRQRVALARALVRRPPILLLDEASSALDARTEAAIVANLQRLRCTRIIIAHRLSTIASADLIAVLDDGRLVESGTHEQLLARGGAYAGLVAAQVGRGGDKP